MTEIVLVVALISYIAFLLIERHHFRFMADHYKREADYWRCLVRNDSGDASSIQNMSDEKLLRAIVEEIAAEERQCGASHKSTLHNNH